jgi:hypothetical protein
MQFGLLSKCRFGDKRFTWDGEEGEDDVFYTPLESPVNEDSSCSLAIKSNQIHLQVHGYVHSKIVKQLFEFETFPFVESPWVGARMNGSNLADTSTCNNPRKKME